MAFSCGRQANQAAQVLAGSGGRGAASPSGKGQQVSVSAASARLLWQTALRFITLTQLQQARLSYASLTVFLPNPRH